MSVHDHHNDPNDPVNQPRKRSRPMDPIDRPVDSLDRPAMRREGMGSTAWLIGLVLLAVIGGIIYSMSGPTTTATGPSPAGTTTTGSGTTAPRTTTGTGTQTTPPAATQTTPPASPAPAPAR